MNSITMRFSVPWFLTLLLACGNSARAERDALLQSLRKQEPRAWETALQIWKWAEPGYQEEQSAALLSQQLKDAGFDVQHQIAEIPTAFVATFGQGSPTIGILAEYDALPGLSQKAEPQREALEPGGYGHGCGHHLFGTASVAAAIAVAEQIQAGTLSGTVRLYGCPAEEGGSAKVFLVLDGQFDECDAVLHWHPSDKNAAGDRSSLARMAVKFRFRGKAAHAAGAPEQGRSALDAIELMNHATQLMREHTPDSSRIHHVITAGGAAPNVVPNFGEVYYYVRHPESEVVRDLYRRLVLCARGAEMATETKLEVDFEGGIKEIMPNSVLSELVYANLRELNNLEWSDEGREFAVRIQNSLAQPQPLESIREVTQQSGVGMGSTDVGDVSWVVPTVGFNTSCFVPGVPGHSWQAVACGASPLARKGMHLASQVLAVTAWDLISDPSRLSAAKEEHATRVADRAYETLMEPGQKPPLDYRRPASERR